MRGVAFIHSPLLVDTKRVSNDVMHVSDWLPTLYHAAGGDLDDMKIKLDGYNMWNTISLSEPSPRKEVVHNIDPITKNAAIRIGKYKLIVNQNMNYYSSWYQVLESSMVPRRMVFSNTLKLFIYFLYIYLFKKLYFVSV